MLFVDIMNGISVGQNLPHVLIKKLFICRYHESEANMFNKKKEWKKTTVV